MRSTNAMKNANWSRKSWRKWQLKVSPPTCRHPSPLVWLTGCLLILSATTGQRRHPSRKRLRVRSPEHAEILKKQSQENVEAKVGAKGQRTGSKNRQLVHSQPIQITCATLDEATATSVQGRPQSQRFVLAGTEVSSLEWCLSHSIVQIGDL
jgi:hypothetical protein